jgi:hypothetical protein
MGMTKPGTLDIADISVVDADLDILDVHDHSTSAKGLAVKRVNSAVFASRPAFSIAGQIYFASDTSRLFLDTGAAWSEVVLNSTAQAVTFTNGLTVSAGNVGIGGAPITGAGLTIFSTNSTVGTTQYGVVAVNVGGSDATFAIHGVHSQPGTSAAAYTTTTVSSLHALSPVKGAGSTITSSHGMLIEAITSGNTNNYGIYVGAPSGGSGDNLSLFCAGATQLAGGALLGGVALSKAGYLGLGVSQTATASAGANGAPPATVGGYLVATFSGSAIRIPYYLV